MTGIHVPGESAEDAVLEDIIAATLAASLRLRSRRLASVHRLLTRERTPEQLGRLEAFALARVAESEGGGA